MARGFNIINEDGSLFDLSTDATSQEILNALGQYSGSDIWTKLDEVLYRLNNLEVEATLASGTGIENIVQIEDGLGGQFRVKVDASNRFWVATPPPEAPAGTIAVKRTEYGSVATSDDDVYVIPSGETLTIVRMAGGSEQDPSFGSAIELWRDPNGDGTNMEIVDVIMANGNSDQHDLNETIEGDGTYAIRMRRIRFSGGSKMMFGRWEGYY